MYKFLANTIFLGKDIISLTECHSTNDLAMERVKAKVAAEGSIIISEKQTKGRGQRGNQWQSEAGKNLTFSIILRPDFLDPTEQFDMNIAVSLAIWEVLNDYANGLKVKWPNDLYHESEGKIGGILIENSIGSRGIDFSVIGIGLNINQKDFAISGASSLYNLSGLEFDRWEVFKLLIQALEKKYMMLKKGGREFLRASYIQNLYQFGELKSYEDGEKFLGRITGITQEGKLIIEKENGTKNHYGFKEVTFL
ncbi:hypothetical protein P872_25145 [Rhodonellum psychrophilum GCM71 = DSM 17998]|uniref:BPL/LPL catalytic domain-containing protein n=2 Tax=Rhodonellum TaxID=336827 RepID=U5BUY2_9BACT|nr:MULTISPECIES: biotin--[acetyl-CoA-carboxylase] ligase [Rhodonellum]ERM84445.1 hypothetical protein P872_25145 [Rhodonellum psychrophilum GCM71 = DSM 17998]MDO9550969.1 biotin--[acetyl-CoA-carboxylase] ligase [Rhodonellum sp.]SDZ00319.1 BirA family transcriptional regulator, biotin operon repressor / biotin-[acetyl-CoA-carboxylase] ligase [Rhodonellum ikkaensis]